MHVPYSCWSAREPVELKWVSDLLISAIIIICGKYIRFNWSLVWAWESRSIWRLGGWRLGRILMMWWELGHWSFHRVSHLAFSVRMSPDPKHSMVIRMGRCILVIGNWAEFCGRTLQHSFLLFSCLSFQSRHKNSLHRKHTSWRKPKRNRTLMGQRPRITESNHFNLIISPVVSIARASVFNWGTRNAYTLLTL